MKIRYIPLVGLCFFAVGILCGKIFFAKNTTTKLDTSQQTFETRLGKGFSFINPLLECNIAQLGGREVKVLDEKISRYVSQYLSANNALHKEDIAVYYRDLNNGPWFGVNEDADFSPASLLKLPVLMAYYKQAELTPEILQKKIVPTGKEAVIPQDYIPKQHLAVDKEYTVDELIRRMIVYSDNQSLVLLENNIAPALIDKVTIDLGIATATNTTPDDYMSVKDYSALFRVLFNASYLSEAYSEKALKLLSDSDFTQGIVAGIGSKDVKVSHKMGERQLPTGVEQLHDCGIVYFPNHPYLLCIMTRGSNFDTLAGSIRDISKMVYQEMDLRY